MPGRTPAEAFKAFIEPIRTSLSLLGSLHVTCTYRGGGRPEPERVELWTVNEGAGISLGKHLFKASMQFGFMKDPTIPGGPWRCTTRQYRYTLLEGEKEIVGWHWHPESKSMVTDPHLHVGAAALSGTTTALTNKTHVATGRVSIEAVVKTLVQDLRLSSATPSQILVLNDVEDRFKTFRSWS